MSVWGLFFSSFIAATIFPGGSEAVLAYLVAEGSSPAMQLVAVASFGNTLGALTTWFLGYLTAKKYPLQQLLPGKKQQAIASVRRWGRWILLFSWLPVVGDGLCFAGGWLRLPLWSSTLAILLGKTARYTAIAVLFL